MSNAEHLANAENLALAAVIFATVAVTLGSIVAVVALAGPIHKAIVRARKSHLWRKLPSRETAWNEGYDAALDDFPCTHSATPKSQVRNPYTGYEQAGA